jgi:hypothetical protein
MPLHIVQRYCCEATDGLGWGRLSRAPTPRMAVPRLPDGLGAHCCPSSPFAHPGRPSSWRVIQKAAGRYSRQRFSPSRANNRPKGGESHANE